jgi:hypothetical protein
LWRNDAFHRFFYDEHAINYLTPLSVERLLQRLEIRDWSMGTRQGYSFINHVSWYLTNAPRTTGVVGGDNFVANIVAKLRAGPAEAGFNGGQATLATQMADLVARFDAEYRQLIERHSYGNQIRFVITR